jgi:hypothetical protein
MKTPIKSAAKVETKSWIDAEADAIRDCLKILAKLSPKASRRVATYVYGVEIQGS